MTTDNSKTNIAAMINSMTFKSEPCVNKVKSICETLLNVELLTLTASQYDDVTKELSSSHRNYQVALTHLLMAASTYIKKAYPLLDKKFSSE